MQDSRVVSGKGYRNWIWQEEVRAENEEEGNKTLTSSALTQGRHTRRQHSEIKFSITHFFSSSLILPLSPSLEKSRESFYLFFPPALGSSTRVVFVWLMKTKGFKEIRHSQIFRLCHSIILTDPRVGRERRTDLPFSCMEKLNRGLILFSLFCLSRKTFC